MSISKEESEGRGIPNWVEKIHRVISYAVGHRRQLPESHEVLGVRLVEIHPTCRIGGLAIPIEDI